ncbi:type VI secretion system baseplate subunit TssG, partial [Enterobacter hormaechei]|nr:type VI secretion system baseplate subunit TssG [Enterobacter hormaechei]
MAGTDRSTLVDVITEHDPATPLALDISQYNFYQLVELINRLAVAWDKTGQTDRPDRESIRFRSSASLAFPTRDVISLVQSKRGFFELEVSFMGLHGSQSPMPG